MTTGKQLRDAGIAQVLSTEEEWRRRYREILLDWFESQPEGFRFTGETLRKVAKQRGLGEPHHHCAWGGASKGLYAELRKRMRKTGRCIPAESEATHGHPLQEYEKTVARRYQYVAALAQMELLA
jgi:diadenosine tetraphosphatase ApaH/serine/threonine PP2A family protein phosphatase